MSDRTYRAEQPEEIVGPENANNFLQDRQCIQVAKPQPKNIPEVKDVG